MDFKPQVIIDENGYVKEHTLGGNIGGIEVALPSDLDDFIKNFTSYKLIDGLLIKDQNKFEQDALLRQKNILRGRRKRECFEIINRGTLWYETLDEWQKEELQTWYHQWLDVTETFNVPQQPNWLK